MPSASMAAIAAAMLAYFTPSTSATACADSSFAAVVSSYWVASCEAFASSSAYAVKGTLSEAAIASATAVESVLFFADAFAM